MSLDDNEDWDFSDECSESQKVSDKILNLSSEVSGINITSNQTELRSPAKISTNSSLKTENSPPKSITFQSTTLSTGKRTLSNDSASDIRKSAPANPLTTKHEVNSIPVVNSSSSSISDTVSDLAQVQLQQQLTPSKNANFFNNMLSSAATSFTFGKSSSEQNLNKVLNGSPDQKLPNDSTTMLSHRKIITDKKRNISMSSADIAPLSPLREDQKPIGHSSESSIDTSFDTDRYVSEYFKDTTQRYATIMRNEEFHKLFKSIPKYERLLDDFSCAISREILLQGRIYITEHNICFNSNLLVWITNLVIPFTDIQRFEKTATAGLFNNGITINLKDGTKHSFASFISRDSTFNIIESIVKASNQYDSQVPGPTRLFLDTQGAGFIQKAISLEEEDEVAYQQPFSPELSSALLSIDGDTPKIRRRYSSSSSDSNYEEDGDSADSNSTESSKTEIIEQKAFKLNDESKYKYDGPLIHTVTKSEYEPASNKETIIANENFQCPPGTLYQILFGEENQLIIDLLTSQDSSNFSEFTPYAPNSQGQQERTYEYIKSLNYSVGPKSTKCIVKETVEHLDYKGYINAVNTTQTPDVPSGNSFTVKTRYIITWNSSNTSHLVVSFWVDWISSSWMKSIIEKSCKSGQEAAVKALIDILKKYVNDNTHIVTESVSSTQVTIEKPEAVPVIKAETIKVEKPVLTTPIGFSIGISFNHVVIALLTLILLVQLLILKAIYNPVPKATHSILNSISEANPRTEELLFKGHELVLWDWINDRADRANGPTSSSTIQIQNDLDELIARWSEDKLNTKEGELLVKQFEDKLDHYFTENSSLASHSIQSRKEELKAAIISLLQ